ncbi:MAG TPA: M14 family zinc carboxypeptidase [Vicinamibacterales bacterium]
MRSRRRAGPWAVAAGALIGGALAAAAQQKIYWGDEVPPGWTGKWPAEVQTIAERTGYTRTMSSIQNIEFITALRARSESLHVVNMFISPQRKAAPAMVIATPRVTSAQDARASGKPVVFLFGNIHPPESEAAEALQMIARDLAIGPRKQLLQNQIVIIAPIFNVDGTDTFVTQNGSLGSETPHIFGTRENAAGFDLNRDAVKLETVEATGMYRLLNEWDPVLLLDGHLMSRVNHGYANTYGTTTVPAAAPGPRDYTHDTLFPAVRDMVRKQFGLEVFTHALFTPNTWPPTGWSHDRAAWTVEAKFIVNDYGLRNRLAIITETPGQPSFERRIYAQYAYFAALLEYTNAHAKEMQAVVKAADEKTVADVQARAESGELRNWLDGEYRSRGKIDVLGYRTNVAEYRPGTSFMSTRPGTASGPPETVKGVDDLTMPVGTRDAVVPRAYVIPAELSAIVTKLRAHNIRVQPLDRTLKAEGEEFLIKGLRTTRSGGYEMTVLDGAMSPLVTRDFPAGTFYLDMAQPMANAAFYYLEPQARDGFVGWGVMNEILRKLTAAGGQAVYPIFKMRREVK